MTASPENVQGTEDKLQTAAFKAHGLSSDGKDNALSADKQVSGEESLAQLAEIKGAQTMQGAVKAAEAEANPPLPRRRREPVSRLRRARTRATTLTSML